VELSNNLAENSMRPVAIGRKNWLHVGSVKAGPKVARVYKDLCKRSLHLKEENVWKSKKKFWTN